MGVCARFHMRILESYVSAAGAGLRIALALLDGRRVELEVTERDPRSQADPSGRQEGHDQLE